MEVTGIKVELASGRFCSGRVEKVCSGRKMAPILKASPLKQTFIECLLHTRLCKEHNSGVTAPQDYMPV